MNYKTPLLKNYYSVLIGYSEEIDIVGTKNERKNKVRQLSENTLKKKVQGEVVGLNNVSDEKIIERKVSILIPVDLDTLFHKMMKYIMDEKFQIFEYDKDKVAALIERLVPEALFDLLKIQNNDGNTPLHGSFTSPSKEYMEACVQKLDAKELYSLLTIRNKKDQTVLHKIFFNIEECYMYFPEHYRIMDKSHIELLMNRLRKEDQREFLKDPYILYMMKVHFSSLLSQIHPFIGTESAKKIYFNTRLVRPYKRLRWE